MPSVSLLSGDSQPLNGVEINTPGLLVLFIGVAVMFVVHKDPKLAVPIGAAAAVVTILLML
ncbi:hypothetical protein [Spirillospora sp. NPDC047279]|uniref:hypothetical protein n=1 Tax=Spirillospora sp. NPDC047279 TaxID=3155478 RepID=UPI0033ED4EAE